MLITDNFEAPVLFAPAKISGAGCNSLKIITAFTDVDRIQRHMISLQEGMECKKYVKKIAIDIIVGMPKSISVKKHNDICRMMHFFAENSKMPDLSIKYIGYGKEVHSKIYLWSKDGSPELAFCGSLNYTMNAFFKRRESVSDVSPEAAEQYYQELLTDCVDYSDNRVPEIIKHGSVPSLTDDDPDNNKDYDYYDKLTPDDIINISLLQRGDKIGYGSGLNWGIRPNGTKRNPNQAYIPYNKSDRKDGFFPDRINPTDKNCPVFKVITKDFGSFHMRMAQQGNKALHTIESNAILGEWIRKQIGIPSGGFIKKEMLENYGSTSIKFRKYKDGIYLMDF